MKEKQRHLFWLFMAALTAVLFGLYFWSLVDVVSPFIMGDDTAQYVLLARAIVHGDGYRSLWVDGLPIHVKFPFGLPLLFAGASFLGPGWGPLFLVPVVSAVGAIFMIFRLFREREAPALAWGIALLTGMTSLMYLYSRSLLSEVSFMFFLMAALFFADRFIRVDRPGVGTAACVVFFMLGAFFLRTAGGALALVFIVMLLKKNKWDFASLGLMPKAVIGAIVVPFFIWTAGGFFWTASGDESYWFLLSKYVDPVKGVLEEGSVGGAGLTFLKGAYALFFYAIPSALTSAVFSNRTLPAGMISFWVMMGWWVAWRQHRSILEVFCLAYLLGLAVWPWAQSSGIRMVLPVMPLLFYYSFMAFKAVPFRFSSARFGLILTAVVFGGLLSLNTADRIFIPSAKAREDDCAGMEKAFAWIRQETSGQALFLSPIPASLYYYTGRRSIAGPPLYGLSDDEIRRLFRAKAIDYVFDPAGVMWQRGAIEPLKAVLELVYERDGQRIYKVHTRGR